MSGRAPEWKRVDDLFSAALDRPLAERADFLERECEGDPDVRRAVQDLLDLEAHVGDFLEATGPSVPPDALVDLGRVEGTLSTGTVVGRYRVVGVLGRGGTSTVYDATRADGSFEQSVALKVLRADDPKGDLAVRFRLERQILADLSHPHIAKVFDGGMTEEGHPYLVVERVDGPPITTHADDARLDLRARLRLFVRVARAVDHAHRSLVIHRDLKPSNILVDKEGAPKLLDFGIAKVVHAEDNSATGDATRWMTPRYASPEQILGRSVTTQTDVHALGLLLYELLTGMRPFGEDTSSRYEVERAICETEPTAPSSFAMARPGADGTPVDFATLSRTLARDLDAIVLKALRKEPVARYASASAMAEDVERYLDGRPVDALGGARLYRAKKFVRRHAWGVATAALVGVMSVGGVAALAVERERAEAAAIAAEREAENARITLDFIADVFQGREPGTAPSDTTSALALVDWGEERVRREFEERPEVKTELLNVLGRAYGNLGYLERAIRMYEEALAVTEELHGPTSEPAIEALGWVAVGLNNARLFDSLVVVQAEMLDRRRALSGDASHGATSLILALAAAHRDAAQLEVAERLAEQGLARIRSNPPPASTRADGLLRAAYVFRAVRDVERAAELYEEGLALWADSLDTEDDNYLVQLNNHAFVLRDLGRTDDAMATMQLVESAVSESHGLGHPRTALVRQNLIGTAFRADRPDFADSVAVANVDALRRHWQGEHERVAAGLMTVGIVRMMDSRPGDALEPLEEARGMATRIKGASDATTIRITGLLGGALLQVGRTDEGRALITDAEERVRAQAARSPSVEPYDWPSILGLANNLRVADLGAEADRFAALIPDDR
ncbi:MAG: protein kinase [Gemmatimonadota bacterium]